MNYRWLFFLLPIILNISGCLLLLPAIVAPTDGGVSEEIIIPKTREDILDIAMQVGKKEGYQVKRFVGYGDEDTVTLNKQSSSMPVGEYITLAKNGDKLKIQSNATAHLHLAKAKAERVLRNFKEKLIEEVNKQEISEVK